MLLWFDKDGENPNDAVAHMKAKEMLNVNVAAAINISVSLLTGLSFLVLIV